MDMAHRASWVEEQLFVSAGPERIPPADIRRVRLPPYCHQSADGICG